MDTSDAKDVLWSWKSKKSLRIKGSQDQYQLENTSKFGWLWGNFTRRFNN